MDCFRTVVKHTSKFKINYTHNLLFLGSCFTENIGNKLTKLKYKTDVNPFGIVYNPESILNCIYLLQNKLNFTEQDLDFYNDYWFSFYHHSRFSATNAQTCLNLINNRLELTRKNLLKSDFLILTFGTAWIYKHKQKNITVSNCHKMPDHLFERQLLTVEDITNRFTNEINHLKKINPEIKIIFTVSPIRHWKDGAVQNQVSKSTLILAIHNLCKKFDFVEYFPAYEIFMDDLRDYRFYDTDMLHPSEQGVNYVWQQFCESYFDKNTKQTINQIEKINKNLEHKPINKNTESYKKFLLKTLNQINTTNKENPELNYAEEIEYITNELKIFE